MPLYDYQCPKCHKVAEVQHKIERPWRRDEMLTPQGVFLFNGEIACLDCDGELMEKLMSAPMVVGERPSKDPMKRAIFSERQVESQHGERWRDAGTTGNEGGIGRKKIFT